jgi:hypothetical protein
MFPVVRSSSAVNPDPRFHVRFHLAHGFRNSFSKCIQNTFIPSQGMDHGNAFRAVEIEIITDPAMVIGSRGKPIIRSRAFIVTQGFKSSLIHLSMQTQALGTFTLPFANDLLFLTIILTQPPAWNDREPFPASHRKQASG